MVELAAAELLNICRILTLTLFPKVQRTVTLYISVRCTLENTSM